MTIRKIKEIHHKIDLLRTALNILLKLRLSDFLISF